MNTTYTFIVDFNKVKSEIPEERPDPQSEALPTSKFVKNIPLPDVAKNSNTPTHQGVSPGFTPEGDVPSPLIDNDPFIITEGRILTLNVAAQNATVDDMWPANLEEDNLADFFTKILPNGDFIRMRDQLLHPAPM